MPGFGHGIFSKAARDKRKRMKKTMSKYDWGRQAKEGGALPIPKSPTPPPPPRITSGVLPPGFASVHAYLAHLEAQALAANPYHRLPREQATADFLHAVLQDDLGTMNLIHDVYKQAHNWMIEARGSSIGGVPIATPIVFYAVDGSGEALQWLIDKGADLQAKSNFALSPAVAFAASKGRAASTAHLLLAMGVTDIEATLGSLHFKHLSDAARHYGHDDLAARLEHVRAHDVKLVAPELPAPQKKLIYKKTPPKV